MTVLIDHRGFDEVGTDPADEAEVRTLRLTVPNAVREGVVDVLSMRSFVRACKIAFGYRQQDDFDRALVKMINLNGAMARAIEREQRHGDQYPSRGYVFTGPVSGIGEVRCGWTGHADPDCAPDDRQGGHSSAELERVRAVGGTQS